MAWMAGHRLCNPRGQPIELAIGELEVGRLHGAPIGPAAHSGIEPVDHGCQIATRPDRAGKSIQHGVTLLRREERQEGNRAILIGGGGQHTELAKQPVDPVGIVEGRVVLDLNRQTRRGVPERDGHVELGPTRHEQTGKPQLFRRTADQRYLRVGLQAIDGFVSHDDVEQWLATVLARDAEVLDQQVERPQVVLERVHHLCTDPAQKNRKAFVAAHDLTQGQGVEIAAQSAVSELVILGPLPSSAKPDVGQLEKFQSVLAKIKQPISDEDARALVRLFGPDDCFGLAWSLLHLIETAPNWPLEDCLQVSGNEWIERLRERAQT